MLVQVPAPNPGKRTRDFKFEEIDSYCDQPYFLSFTLVMLQSGAALKESRGLCFFI